MTPRANSLTGRDTTPARPASGVWTMSAGDVRAFLDAMARVGYNMPALMSATGLDHVATADPDARIACDAIGALICGAQQQRFTPNLMLELARVTPLGAYALLDYLVATSETVAAGMHQLVRYFRLIGNPITFDIDESADPTRIEMTGGAAPSAFEYNAALMVLHLRNEADGPFSASGVTFRHAVDDVRAWVQTLGCPVVENGPSNTVAIERSSWQLPLRRRDPILRKVLEARADDVLARLPAREGLALEVQRALLTRATAEDVTIDGIAQQLAMSGRTLQRRLAAEGVTFQDLLDDARKEAAGRYLRDSQLAICEIAYLVGYSEPAPFHRAFKRWYGVTPEQFRSSRF